MAYWLSNVDLQTTPPAEAQERADCDWRSAAPLARELEAAFLKRERAVAAVVELRRCDPLALRQLDNLERQADQAKTLVSPLLAEVMGEGLRRRLGLFLRDLDAQIYYKLRSLGALVPAGIAVCFSCGLVFTPKSSHAEKCSDCHNNPRTPALEFQRFVDGGMVQHTPAGAFRFHVCVECEALFYTESPKARTCSNACRQAASRRRKRGEAPKELLPLERRRQRDLENARRKDLEEDVAWLAALPYQLPSPDGRRGSSQPKPSPKQGFS
jgi:hypothetical protein